ncbi:hypothetical protein CC_1212 [Caulobacter vibrioides CB15]|uniref:Uncharacterized protein n=1 Tax=Caulobacter vibrioides (strain ATCC 19089 / CIP 103742 / CB 15) TaxID=190650 RepID=Q9A8Y5_CAUVC|nr:hypothetical protein CC_1212 [Caulobacter vibrioides CB15]
MSAPAKRRSVCHKVNGRAIVGADGETKNPAKSFAGSDGLTWGSRAKRSRGSGGGPVAVKTAGQPVVRIGFPHGDRLELGDRDFGVIAGIEVARHRMAGELFDDGDHLAAAGGVLDQDHVHGTARYIEEKGKRTDRLGRRQTSRGWIRFSFTPLRAQASRA